MPLTREASMFYVQQAKDLRTAFDREHAENIDLRVRIAQAITRLPELPHEALAILEGASERRAA